MTRLIRVTVTLLLAIGAASLLAGAGPDDEIVNAEKGWAAAVVALDFAALDKIYHDDLIYAHSTGTIETKSQYLAKLRSGKQKYTAIGHHETIVRRQGDAAVAHSIVTMKGTSVSGPFDNRLMMIHTWFKSGGSWRLVAHQTTGLPK
ncbi:MAG: nuclear transport factor 2 family protein [Acidobacteria bacterium]|nr:nuclear transport factor 2 family protein [Acidobacteriota bacterium]